MTPTAGVGAKRPHPTCVPKARCHPDARPAFSLQWIGALRDGLIAAGTIVYLLGYLSWAFYAWTHELGVIPALDAQYFLAGLYPFAVLVAFYFLARGLIWLFGWLSTDLSPGQKKLGWTLQTFGAVLLFVGMFGSNAMPAEWAQWATISAFAGGGVMTVAAFFSRQEGDRRFQKFQLGLMWFGSVLGTVFLINIYLASWFPQLPHEWGGPSPRLVQFDLDTTQLSKTSRPVLLPDAAAAETAGIHRSRDLHLIFDGSDFVLVKTAPDSSAYKIQKRAIGGVFPGAAP
jgi:hypothetical protein